jgi:hypothetical protein
MHVLWLLLVFTLQCAAVTGVKMNSFYKIYVLQVSPLIGLIGLSSKVGIHVVVVVVSVHHKFLITERNSFFRFASFSQGKIMTLERVCVCVCVFVCLAEKQGS